MMFDLQLYGNRKKKICFAVVCLFLKCNDHDHGILSTKRESSVKQKTEVTLVLECQQKSSTLASPWGN